jgi:hypothetical protein
MVTTRLRVVCPRAIRSTVRRNSRPLIQSSSTSAPSRDSIVIDRCSRSAQNGFQRIGRSAPRMSVGPISKNSKCALSASADGVAARHWSGSEIRTSAKGRRPVLVPMQA